MTQKKIGYLGPEGTYSQEATEAYLASFKEKPEQCDGENGYAAIPYNDISDILAAVASGELDKAVVPVENSIEGSVNITLDVLVSTPNLVIEGEVILPVRHHLLVHKNYRGKLSKVLSHPQGLAQCQNYLKKNYPGALRENTFSTSEAARRVAETGESWGAVANILAAEKYNLQVIAHDVQDYPDNETRFIVVGREMAPSCRGNNKTSLVFSMAKDRPGGLYEVLGEFSQRGINLTKIESRPSKKGLGDYIFFIDFEGHIEDDKISAAVAQIQEKSSFFKILGSYKQARGG